MSGDPRDDEVVSKLRAPPHSIEAEQSVLGALLLDISAWDRVGDALKEDDFYRHTHRTIYAAIATLANATKAVDAITVFERLERIGKAVECGGMPYLHALTESVASAVNIRRYAEIVRERAVERRLIGSLDEAISMLYADAEKTLADKIDSVATAIAAIDRGTDRREPRLLGDILVQRIDHITEVHEKGVPAGWPTRVIPWLDRKLNGGLRAGNVYILAARPSIGKSSLAESIGLAMARDDAAPVLYLSQEMPEAELGDRAIAQLGGVDYSNLQTAQLNDIEWGQLSNGVEIGRGIPFYVDDTPALTMRQIRQKARRIKGLRVLILDYLQLSEGESKGRNDSRASEIGSISRGLKKLAKEMGIAVIALSQLNRKVEERPGKRPIMADLRDSGEIEADADVIIFLWPVRSYGDADGKLVGLHVDKNRQGPRGEIGLNFRGRYQTWEESTESVRAAATKDGFE